MSERTESLLREYLRSVESADVPSAFEIGDGIARFERRAARRQRGLAATSAIALIGLAAGVVWNTSASPQQITGADGIPSTTIPVVTEVPSTIAVDTGPWSPIPVGPKPITGAAVVWTGTEAWMVGGTYADSTPSGIHAYNPTTATWRVVVNDLLDTGASPLVFWSGESIVIIGSDGSSAHLVVMYDPVDGSIVHETKSATDSIDATVPWTWTGSELLVWPTAMEVTPTLRPRAFKPQTGEWRELAEPPIEARTNAASIWTGSEWIVWGGDSGPTLFADGAAYNPVTDTWRVLSESPLTPRNGPAVWTGREMIVRSGSTDGAAYDPVTDTWREIAPGVGHPGFIPVWTGELLVLFAKGGAVWYDPDTDNWSTGDFSWGFVPHLDQSPVWTGKVVLLLGSYDGSTGGAAFTPPST